MTTLKVGTRVQYSSSAGPKGLPSFAGLTGTVKPKQSYFDGAAVLWDNGILANHSFEYLIPIDDSVPDAPKEVMYFPDGNDKECRLLVRQTSQWILIGSKVHDTGIWQLIDAETALQLSHDLLRMGLALKRKQEQ